MVLGDLVALFGFGRQDNDRGTALEKAWEERPAQGRGIFLGGGLGTQFQGLASGEQDGWRPSLIISPTIVEGGNRLLISNLALEGLGGGYEFFRLFPGADLKLSTALRMNAAFPYVSPAVNLPTRPLRRVIDAGYLDNYGIDLATEWLERHKEWLVNNLERVILVQLRAYPLDLVFRAVDRDEAGDRNRKSSGSRGGLLAELKESQSSNL